MADYVPRTDLPVNIDASYVDDAAHPDVKAHQQHTDELHWFHNLFDFSTFDDWPDGGLGFWDLSAQKFSVLDPTITGSPGPPGSDGKSLTPRGAWSGGTSYVPGDVVRSAGAVYACKIANTNSDPASSTTNWMFLIADGVAGPGGAQGITGATGAPGKDGPTSSVVEVFPNLAAAFTLDAGSYDVAVGTLTTDCSIDFEDTSGARVSAITFRLYQGSGGPHNVTWSGVTWITSDSLPPDLSGMSIGDFIVIAFDQVDGVWCGYVPGSGVAGTPPPVIYPVLAFDELFNMHVSTDQSTPYTSGVNLQIGNERVAHAFVITVETTNDPPLHTLAGAGASGWDAGATTLIGTGATRRRLSHFVAQDAVSGPASPLVVGQAVSPGSEVVLAGCEVLILRTTRSPLTAKALAVAKSVAAQGSGTAVTVALAAASDPTNRGIAAVGDNGTTATFTPEANWVLQGSSPLTITNPVQRMHVMADTTSFDTSPSATFSAAVLWGEVATECQQGPTS